MALKHKDVLCAGNNLWYVYWGKWMNEVSSQTIFHAAKQQTLQQVNLHIHIHFPFAGAGGGIT